MNAATPVAIPATDPYRVEARAVADALDTDLERGLSAAEAARRLAADGPNELLSASPVPNWRLIFSARCSPIFRRDAYTLTPSMTESGRAK